MNREIEPVGEIDLAAYVDDQLDPVRRVEVAAYLATHPEEAARVMADIRTRDALRLLAASGSEPPRSILDAARRLRRTLLRRAVGALAPRVALGGLLLGAAVLGADEVPDLLLPATAQASPRYVEEAEMAHRTALLRAGMRSQLESSPMDAAEIASATKIVLPPLPPGWRVLDVQLFPSDDGPSLQVTVDRGDGRPLSLFAVRARTSAPVRPAVASRFGTSVAYWQEGEIAMALTGDAPEAEIDRAAEDLADNLPG